MDTPVDRNHARAARKETVVRLATAMFDTFVKDDGGEYLSKTGSLLQSSSLRPKKCRKQVYSLLEAASSLEANCRARIWTKATVRDSLRVLLGLLGESHIELPTYPGFDTNAWVTTQTEKLQKLLRQGKKNNWALSHQGAMDNAETLPMTFENVEARYI